jgi:hypothetical protein
MSTVRRVNIDKVGGVASAICAVHCLLTGVALGLLSVLGLGFLGDPATDLVFFGVAVVAGIIAVVHGIRVHKSKLPALIFVAGLVSIVLAHVAFDHGHGHESADVGSVIFSVLGGLCLVGFHALNLKLQHDRKCCHEAHCHHTDATAS